MATSDVARFWPRSSTRYWLVFCGGTLAIFYALIFGARPLYAQVIYHVDDDADEGLVAHWQFDFPTEVTYDYYNLIPATLTNHTSLATSFTNNVPSLRRDNPNSLTLDGSNDRMTVVDDARLNRTGDFTVAAWVRRNSINTYDPIYDSGFNANAWWFFITGDRAGTAEDNVLGFGIRGVAEFYATTPIPADGTWRHVAIIFDTTANPNVSFYIDGDLDASVHVANTIQTPSGLKQIGGITDGSSLIAAFDGSLDEVRFYEIALIQDDIVRLAAGRTCLSDGGSWETALPYIQCAQELPFSNTIHIAKGRYIPGVHPNARFFLDDGDKLIGGFNGNEAADVDRPAVPLDQSNPVNYLDSAQYSVLTGDVLGNDPPDAMTDLISPTDEEVDNVDRVVDIAIGISGTTLDGFVVTGGRNDAGNGGGVRVFGNTSIFNSIFYLNRANRGGGLNVGGSALPSLLSLRFVKNEALIDGGGLFGDGPAIMSNARFVNNSAGRSGGGFASSSSAASLANVTFTGNQANGGVGGGVYFCCTSGILQVSNVLVEGNESAGDGGGMNVCCGGSISGQYLTLTGNQSAANGGGLFICCTGITSTLQGVTITANIAMTDGGGLHLSGGGAISITNGLLANNDAGHIGGAVRGEFGGNFTLIDGSVEENSAQTTGGGISVDLADIFLTNVEVARNTTDASGGAGLSLTDSNSVLKDVEIIENGTGDDDGAGIHVRDGTLSMDRVSFLGNTANQSGGAMSVESDAQVTATNLLLVGNVGNTEGDADNVANAIDIEDASTLHLINSSLAANSGAGVSLFKLQDTAKITFTNVILWDNAPAGNIIEGTASVVEQNVIVGNPTSGVNPRFTMDPLPGDGNWATSADNNYGDLRLLATSPALDQGNGALLPAGITQDFGGNPRIFDLGYVANTFASPVDLGAYEARFVAPIANPGAAYSGNEGAAIALNASASIDDGNIITFAWDCNSDNIIDAITGSPTGSFCTYGDNGTFTLLLGVTDNDFVSHAVSVAVTVNNVAPSAQDDGATTAEDTAVTINALTNDSDVPADPLTISAVGTPTNGSAAIVQGQIVYTPTADFNGSDSFTYTISDGDGGSDSATVTVTVTPVDEPDVPVEKPTMHLPMLSKH